MKSQRYIDKDMSPTDTPLGHGKVMNRQGLKKALIVVHDLVMTGVAVVATFFVRFEGPAPAGAPCSSAAVPAALHRLRRRGLLVLPALQVQVALRVPAGPLQHLPGCDHPGGHPAGGGLRPRLAAAAGHLLLRQDHHRPLLADPDVPAGRPGSPSATANMPARATPCSAIPARRPCCSGAAATSR